MFKIFFLLVAVTTMVSMSLIGNIGKVKPVGMADIKQAPVMIHENGSVTFPGRIPAPETVYELRRAIEMEDVEMLNAILVKNRLFVAPNNY